MYLNNRISKKPFLILVLFILSSVSVFTQEYKSDFWDHVRFGGGLGLNSPMAFLA